MCKKPDSYDMNHTFIFMANLESRMEVFQENLNGSVSLGKCVIFVRGNIPLRILYSPSDLTVKLGAEVSPRSTEMGY